MMPDEIRRRMDALIAEDGGWSAHNIDLGHGIETIPGHPPRESLSLRRVLQTAADVAGKPLEALRVLDLACLEGLYGLEFARHGATVVGIEGRATGVRKARFAAEVLHLENIEFRQDDVRNLSVESYGRFDVVLCLGILYHLDAPDAFAFVERIASVCTCAAIFHTHVSSSPLLARPYKDRTYWGRPFLEHLPKASTEEVKGALWASLDNSSSFWMTEASLWNLLQRAGFTSVLECRIPFLPAQGDDHKTLVALKGTPLALACTPKVNALPPAEWPERRPYRIHPGQRWYYRWAREVRVRFPQLRVMQRFLRIRWDRRQD